MVVIKAGGGLIAALSSATELPFSVLEADVSVALKTFADLQFILILMI